MELDSKKIELICAQKGILFKDLAKNANVSKGTVYNIIHGNKVLASTIYKIAKSLRVDAKDILL